MNKHGITKENLMETLPPALREDPTVVALADALATVLVDRQPEIDRLLLYPAIDTLDEPLLDILAYDYKVDWWDPNYSLEEKRRTLKDSWRVHKLLGTKAAVEMAISDIYPNTQVEEWFEYGGNPYGFKIKLDLTGEKWTDDRPRRILERVEFYKSLRSHIDELQYTIRLPPATICVGGGVGAFVRLGIPEGEDSFDFQQTVHVGGQYVAESSIVVPRVPDHFHFQHTIHAGGDYGSETIMGVPKAPDSFRFQRDLHAGGGVGIHAHGGIPEDLSPPPSEDVLRVGGRFSARVETGVSEDTSPPSATTILRTGGVCTIISNLSKGD